MGKPLQSMPDVSATMLITLYSRALETTSRNPIISDWTHVRPPGIANQAASGNISADEKMLKSLKMSVGDLTDFILEQITSKDWIRKAPLVFSHGKQI
jgi:hypothetical protein